MSAVHVGNTLRTHPKTRHGGAHRATRAIANLYLKDTEVVVTNTRTGLRCRTGRETVRSPLHSVSGGVPDVPRPRDANKKGKLRARSAILLDCRGSRRRMLAEQLFELICCTTPQSYFRVLAGVGSLGIASWLALFILCMRFLRASSSSLTMLICRGDTDA